MIFLFPRGKGPRKLDVHHGVRLQALRLVLVREGQSQVASSEFHQAVIKPRGDCLVAGIVQRNQQLSVAKASGRASRRVALGLGRSLSESYWGEINVRIVIS